MNTETWVYARQLARLMKRAGTPRAEAKRRIAEAHGLTEAQAENVVRERYGATAPNAAPNAGRDTP